MKTLQFIIVCLVVTSCKSVSREEEVATIKNIYEKMCTYVCTGDLKNYMNLWAKSSEIEVIHPEYSEWQTGWDEVNERYKKMLESGFKCSFTNDKINVHVSEKMDMAWVTCDSRLRAEGDSTQGQRVWGTFVLEKIDNNWLVVHAFAGTKSEQK